MVSKVRVAHLSVIAVDRIATLAVGAVVGCWWWRRKGRLIRARVRLLLLLLAHAAVVPGIAILRLGGKRMGRVTVSTAKAGPVTRVGRDTP